MSTTVKKQFDPAKTAIVGHPKNELDIPARAPKATADEMSTSVAVLSAAIEQENKIVALGYAIEGYDPLDVAVQFTKLFAETFGVTQLRDTPSMFGPIPPKFFGVRTGPNPDDLMYIPLGRMGAPFLDEKSFLEIQLEGPDRRQGTSAPPKFILGGQIKGRHRDQVAALVAALKERMKTASIYRGKTVEVDYEWMREEQSYDPSAHCPRFIDPSSADPNALFFSDELSARLNAKLWTPLLLHEKLLAKGFKAKRGILLAGPPGTGKSEVFKLASKVANSRGVTVVHCRSVSDFEAALRFALLYQPAVVIVEDIDRVASGDRNEDMDRLSNAIDGTEIKGQRVTIIASTNDVEAINAFMLRSGRLGDAFIMMTHPDAVAVDKMIRYLARGELDPAYDGTEVSALMANSPASEIVATVEGARLYAFARSKGESTLISHEDIINEFKDRAYQRTLLTPKPIDTRSEVKKSADSIASALRYAADKGLPLSNLSEAAAEGGSALIGTVGTILGNDAPNKSLKTGGSLDGKDRNHREDAR